MKSFSCFEKARVNQNTFLEWQANEGAAELLVPYKSFVPEAANLVHLLENKDYSSFYCLKMELCDKYFISDIVLQNRIEGLMYEIQQYRCGTSLNNLRLLSKNKQQKLGIEVTSFKQLLLEAEFASLEDFYFSWIDMPASGL